MVKKAGRKMRSEKDREVACKSKKVFLLKKNLANAGLKVLVETCVIQKVPSPGQNHWGDQVKSNGIKTSGFHDIQIFDNFAQKSFTHAPNEQIRVPCFSARAARSRTR